MSTRSQAAVRSSMDAQTLVDAECGVTTARARRADTALIQAYLRNKCRSEKAAITGLRIARASLGDGTVWIRALGEIDITTSGQLRAVIAAALAERPERLILDLAGVPFADSQLVHVLEETRGHGAERIVDVLVVRGRPQVLRLLAICGLGHLCAGIA